MGSSLGLTALVVEVTSFRAKRIRAADCSLLVCLQSSLTGLLGLRHLQVAATTARTARIILHGSVGRVCSRLARKHHAKLYHTVLRAAGKDFGYPKQENTLDLRADVPSCFYIDCDADMFAIMTTLEALSEHASCISLS